MDLQQRLESLNYWMPGVATTVDMAVELAVTHNPDLILMDIRLQCGTDGIVAAITIRETGRNLAGVDRNNLDVPRPRG